MKIDKGLDGRGIYRSIYVALWDDPDFRKFSADEKLIFLNLRTSPLTNLAAVYSFYIEGIERQTGLARDVIFKGLKGLCDKGWIQIEDGVIWIVKGLRFDPGISLESPNHLIAIKKTLLGLPRLQIIRDFLDYYQINMPYPIPSRKPLSQPLSNPIPLANPLPFRDQEKDTGKDIEKEKHKEKGEPERKKLFSSKVEILRKQARQLGINDESK